jgi:putative two-component system response regulator
VADAFAAMIAPRAFRAPLSPDEAAAVLADGAGSQWDPALVEQFFACRDELCAICQSGDEA